MSQTIAAPIPAAVDYERTLVLAIEVSNKSWVLAAQVPGLPHTKAKRTINPEAEALLAAISGYRTRAAASGRSTERVIAVYEAGELAIEFSKESCLWRFSGWLKRCKYSLIDKYVR